MHVRSDRRYRFAVAPELLWSMLARTDDYRTWWPWLRGFDGAALEAGARWGCVVQPPLPYVLRFTVTIGVVEAPHRVTAVVSGDILGEARIEITAVDDGAELHLVSVLAPASAVLRAVGRLAGPVARFGHDWVLDTGARQFRNRALGNDER